MLYFLKINLFWEAIMKNIEKLIRENLKDCRIDLIGFANKERFEGVDPQHNPFSIFPKLRL